MVARLNHPNIASIYCIAQDTFCFMAMEFIDGLSLREMIDRLAGTQSPSTSLDSLLRTPTGALDPIEMRFDPVIPEMRDGGDPGIAATELVTPEARRVVAGSSHIRRCCEITLQAAEALAYAHERGVVHRDLKPDNLMLDRQGVVHIIDFGLARFFDDVTLTQTGQLVGTPMYMSPEQVASHLDLDHRTDIYSLGIVLFELLTLRPAVSSTTREGILRKIVTKSLAPITWHNDSVPKELEKVVHKATAKDPDDRYQRSVEFADDLRRVLDGEPVSAGPYRYKFDTREIDAARPQSVFAVALVCFGLGVAWLIYGFLLLIMVLPSWAEVSSVQAYMFASYFVLPAVFLPTAWGLFSGRIWARWIGWIAGALCFGYPVLLWTLLESLTGNPFSVIHFAGIGAFGITVFLVLLQRRTQRWFLFSSDIRQKFRARCPD